MSKVSFVSDCNNRSSTICSYIHCRIALGLQYVHITGDRNVYGFQSPSARGLLRGSCENGWARVVFGRASASFSNECGHHELQSPIEISVGYRETTVWNLNRVNVANESSSSSEGLNSFKFSVNRPIIVVVMLSQVINYEPPDVKTYSLERTMLPN